MKIFERVAKPFVVPHCGMKSRWLAIRSSKAKRRSEEWSRRADLNR
ncbi:MAG: hypothetical protein ABIE14_04820 [Patescibacteria group bacterium]